MLGLVFSEFALLLGLDSPLWDSVTICQACSGIFVPAATGGYPEVAAEL